MPNFYKFLFLVALIIMLGGKAAAGDEDYGGRSTYEVNATKSPQMTNSLPLPPVIAKPVLPDITSLEHSQPQKNTPQKKQYYYLFLMVVLVIVYAVMLLQSKKNLSPKGVTYLEILVFGVLLVASTVVIFLGVNPKAGKKIQQTDELITQKAIAVSVIEILKANASTDNSFVNPAGLFRYLVKRTEEGRVFDTAVSLKDSAFSLPSLSPYKTELTNITAFYSGQYNFRLEANYVVINTPNIPEKNPLSSDVTIVSGVFVLEAFSKKETVPVKAEFLNYGVLVKLTVYKTASRTKDNYSLITLLLPAKITE